MTFHWYHPLDEIPGIGLVDLWVDLDDMKEIKAQIKALQWFPKEAPAPIQPFQEQASAGGR